eukprot:1121308-Prymnesium_polylepis.1
MGIFHGRKRRRGSWVFYFLGDYVGCGDSLQLDQLLKKEGDSKILFADRVQKINRNGVVQDRVLLISDKALYTLSCDPKGKYTIGNRVALAAIESLSMS